jgi:hypothetical protein
MLFMDEPNPYQSPTSQSPLPNSALLLAVAWSVIVALLGGVTCGWCISHFGEVGALALAANGALAGYVSHKITRRGNRLAAVSVVIGACVAFFVAETCWLHWDTVQGEASWGEAIRLWPLFVREYQLSALIGAGSTAYGAWCAYGYATHRAPKL